MQTLLFIEKRNKGVSSRHLGKGSLQSANIQETSVWCILTGLSLKIFLHTFLHAQLTISKASSKFKVLGVPLNSHGILPLLCWRACGGRKGRSSRGETAAGRRGAFTGQQAEFCWEGGVGSVSAEKTILPFCISSLHSVCEYLGWSRQHATQPSWDGETAI